LESPDARRFEVNRYLCEKGVLILEGLVKLAGLPKRGLRLYAFPLKIADVEGSPVRAVVRFGGD
jgi:kynurenine formamidase